MTLIAGIKCQDGFIIAADTAMDHQPIVYQGRKLDYYRRKASPEYFVAIAYAGVMEYAMMASQKIGDAIQKLKEPSYEAIKTEVESVILDFHGKYIYQYWRPDQTEAPNFSMMIGIDGCDGKFGVLCTRDVAVFEVQTCSYGGTGAFLAEFLAERLLLDRHNPGVVMVDTAAAIQLVKQLFRVVKSSGSFVGGDTELIGRLSRGSDGQFFDVLPLDRFYLWGIEQTVINAIHAALRPGMPNEYFESLVEKIPKVIRRIRAEKKDALNAGRTVREIEMADGLWQAAYLDGLGPIANESGTG